MKFINESKAKEAKVNFINIQRSGYNITGVDMSQRTGTASTASLAATLAVSYYIYIYTKLTLSNNPENASGHYIIRLYLWYLTLLPSQ